MRSRTRHETNKRTRTTHLRIATFSTQSGLLRSTHHGFHSYEHQTWRAARKPSNRPCTSSGCTPSLHPVPTSGSMKQPLILLILTIDASGPAMLHYLLPCNHEFLFRRDFRNLFLIKIHVRHHSFRRQTPEPVIQRDVDKLIGLEHFQKCAIGVAGIFDVMG